jgi:DNA-directed RNA polymerase specialized sigma24 family protein
MTTTLTARCIRSDGWWAVDVPEVPGLFTQARRLDQVPTVVLDAAALLTGRPESDFDVTVAPVLEDDDLAVVRDARERRAALVEAERAAAAASRAAVAQLRAEGLTVRDVAEIMGLSPQRVSQLVAS